MPHSPDSDSADPVLTDPQHEPAAAAADATRAIAEAPPPPAADAMGPPIIMLGAGRPRIEAALKHLGSHQRPVIVLTRGSERPAEMPDDPRIRFAGAADPVTACLEAFDHDPCFTFLGATLVAGCPADDAALPEFISAANVHLQTQLTTMDERRAAWQHARAERSGAIERLFGIVDDSTTALQFIMDDIMRAATRDGFETTRHVESYRTDPFRAIRRFDAITRSAPDALLCLVQTGTMALGPLANGLPALCYYSSDPERRPVPPNALTPHDQIFVADPAWADHFSERGASATVLPLATGFGEITVNPDDPTWHCDALLVAHLTDARDVLPGLDDAAFRALDALATQLAFERQAPSSDALVQTSPLAPHEDKTRRIARAVEVHATWHRRRRAAIDIAESGVDLRVYGDERWRAALAGTAAAASYRGALAYRQEMPHAFAGARVVVNVGSLNAPSALNMRAFDVPAVGGCLLTDARPGVDASFDTTCDVATYDHPDALVPALHALLDDPDRRAAISASGRARVAADHSWTSRWPTMAQQLRGALVTAMLLLCLTWMPSARAADTPNATDLTAFLDGAAANGRNAHVFAMHSDGTITDRTLGDADPTRLIESAALSRTLTGAAIMQLVTDQQLRFDDTIADIFARHDIALTEPVARLTVSDLFTHRSGLPLSVDWRGVDLHSLTEAMTRVIALEPDFGPGGRPRDTILNDILLAGIVEAASGVEYERYVRSALLRPAGLDTAITFRADLDWRDRGAAGAQGTAPAFARWFHALRSAPLNGVLARTGAARIDAPFWFGGWSVRDHGTMRLVRAEAFESDDAMLLVHAHDRSSDQWMTLVISAEQPNGLRTLAHQIVHAETPPLRIADTDATDHLALIGNWTSPDGRLVLRLRPAEDGPAVEAWPMTQESINTLAPVGAQVRNLDIVNARSRQVVAALLDDRADRVRDHLAPGHDDDWTFHVIRAVEAHVAPIGPVERHTLIGSWTNAVGTTRTTIYASGPGGTRPITIAWRHGLVTDIDLESPAPTVARFVPRRDGTLASIDLATQHVTVLELATNRDGAAPVLTLGAQAFVRMPDVMDTPVRHAAEPTSGE